jgi:hypothetical protein
VHQFPSLAVSGVGAVAAMTGMHEKMHADAGQQQDPEQDIALDDVRPVVKDEQKGGYGKEGDRSDAPAGAEECPRSRRSMHGLVSDRERRLMS